MGLKLLENSVNPSSVIFQQLLIIEFFLNIIYAAKSNVRFVNKGRLWKHGFKHANPFPVVDLLL